MQRFRWTVVGAVLALVGSGTALAGNKRSAVSVAPRCSTAAVQGAYGIHGTGFVAGSPFSMIGTAVFDGAGRHTGRTTESGSGWSSASSSSSRDAPSTVWATSWRPSSARGWCGRSAGAGSFYEIAHPLVAEAIYEGIGGARQRSLHRLVGRALIGFGRLGQAAPHFARSAEVGDAEAIEALQGAVRQAEEREANREAMAILGALAELLPSGDERWLDVFESMASRAEWVLDHRVEGDVVLGIRAMREIDAALGRREDPGRWAAAKLRLVSFLTYGPGDVAEAERLCREAVALYQQAGDAAGARLAANELAWIFGVQGRFEAMEDGGRAVVAEIAGQLFIGERTVEFHLANAYSKLGVGSKVELVRRAAELGL